MADNDLEVVVADGTVKKTRSIDLGSNVHGQTMFVWEGPEVPADVTGATVRHTVDDNPAVALDPPNAGARFARVRVYETTGASPDVTNRLYYRTDGTAPTADGANAFGYLLHGELIMVKLSTFTNFKMIAETGVTFEVYVEWLANS